MSNLKNPKWRVPEIGVRQIILFYGIFHYKPSIWGYPHDCGNLQVIFASHAFSMTPRGFSVQEAEKFPLYPSRDYVVPMRCEPMRCSYI